LRKKFKVQGALLGLVSVSSVALTLHFNSLVKELEVSHEQLNTKYIKVVHANESYRSEVSKMKDVTSSLEKESKETARLLEESYTKVEKLNEETEHYRNTVSAYKDQLRSLEKKSISTPSKK